MYLHKRLIDVTGRAYEMCGVIDGAATMTKRLQRVSYVECKWDGITFHGHEFHYSTTDATENLFDCRNLRDGREYRAGVRVGNVIGSYMHTHFAGSRGLAERLFFTRR